MINLRRKGNRSRLKAIKELQNAGWIVDVVEKTNRYAKEKDCFGLFDLLALREGQVLLLQISTNRHHTHKQFEDFARKYAFNNILVEQWVSIDRGGWKKHSYCGVD